MKRIYLIILLGFALLVAAQAQELTVKSMAVAGNDISASQYERKDLNGQACALVKVLLASPGAVFEGNVIGDVAYKTGEYWVYLTEGTKELRIKHPQTQPLQVVFNEHGVEKVTGKTTYMLSVLLPQGAASSQTQKLIINYSPSNAMVLVDSKPYQGKGRIEVMLPVGTHDYIIAATGYDTAEGSVKLLATSPRTITENLNKAAGEVSQASSSDASDKEQTRQRKMEEKERAKAEKEQAKVQKERERELAKAKNTSDNPSWNIKIGPNSYKQSFVDLLKLASQGNADAEYRLGRYFDKGEGDLGMRRNNTAAMYWYTKAKDHGIQEAADALKRIGEIPTDKMLVWGIVTDKKDQEAIIGCSVFKNGNSGSITDFNGMFTLLTTKSGADILEFRFVGYSKQKITLDKSKNLPLHIEMK